MPAGFEPLVIAIFIGMIAALCVAGWLQLRRTRKIIMEQERRAPPKGGAPDVASSDRRVVSRYVKTSNVGLLGYCALAVDLAYAVLASELNLMAYFSPPLFVLGGLLGIVLLWTSAYMLSRLFREYGATEG